MTSVHIHIEGAFVVLLDRGSGRYTAQIRTGPNSDFMRVGAGATPREAIVDALEEDGR